MTRNGGERGSAPGADNGAGGAGAGATSTEDRPAAASPRPGDPEITPELVEEHGLTEEEYRQVLEILGREPTFAELGVFSAMWSEHCGYKNSKPLLRTLPTEGPAVAQGPGENAGVVDVGDGWGVAFKIESHNHPSAVEPYQGAATGADGILRDVFTMGARPVALFDSLRFGSLDSPRSRYLFDGVVRGVGDYGNCVGVPTLGGEAVFDPVYEKNPLVNVMCVGLLPLDRLIRGRAEGVGNAVMAVGARTGRDGIHGATFASEELSDETADSRPQVQVGDPFTEKLLMEASLELIERDLLVGIQDMGAAGLTSSATEMAARSDSGIEVDVARVPTREPGMTPYEILLSESQERMLVVARPGEEDQVREVLDRWELEATTIGRVTDDGRFRVKEGDRVVADIPVFPLVDDVPTYTRDGIEDPEVIERRERDLSHARELDDRGVESALLAILDSPSVGNREWIHRQYDTTVGTLTAEGPGGDAAVIRLDGTDRAVAATVDGNGRYVYLEPRRGARVAVAEASRNVACTGARPLGVTNCLNFGNPLGPAVYHQLSEAVAGIGDACRALETPVTGGNVSLYNETPAGPIYPTPVIGMVGILEDLDRRVPSSFRSPDDDIWLVGATREEIGASEYLDVCHDAVAGRPPAVDLEEASRLVEFLVEGARKGLFRSAHDCSDGGLAVALTECAVAARPAPLGVRVDVPDDHVAGLSPAAAFFGESQNRVVVSTRDRTEPEIQEHAEVHGLPLTRLGRVGEPEGEFRMEAAGRRVALPVRRVQEAYDAALPRRMEDQAGITN